MQSSQRKYGKGFPFMFRSQILLGIWILVILFAAFGFLAQEQEKWIPDYNQRDEWQQPEKPVLFTKIFK